MDGERRMGSVEHRCEVGPNLTSVKLGFLVVLHLKPQRKNYPGEEADHETGHTRTDN